MTKRELVQLIREAVREQMVARPRPEKKPQANAMAVSQLAANSAVDAIRKSFPESEQESFRLEELEDDIRQAVHDHWYNVKQ